MLECLYGSRSASYFTHYVVCPFLCDRISDSLFHLLPVLRCQFGQIRDRSHLAYLFQRRLALSYAVVIRPTVEVVRTVGVGDHHFDAIQFHRHVLKLQCVAMQVDRMILLSLC